MLKASALCLTLLLCWSWPAAGQERIAPQRFKVLLIGNSQYSELPKCPTASNNLKALSESFRSLKFTVTVKENLAWPDLVPAIDDFEHGLKATDIAILYYSGHAVQHDNDTYLVPTDFPEENGNLDRQALSLSRIDDDLVVAGSHLLIVDAGRKVDALFRQFPEEGLVMPTRSTANSLIAIPTRAGKFAPEPGGRSTDLYSQALADLLGERGLTAERLFVRVADVVRAATKDTGEQVPEYRSTLRAFYITEPERPIGEVSLNPADKQEYVWIASGSFQMGCVPGDSLCLANEGPRHKITISKGFWMGQNEVRVDSYLAYVNQNKKTVKKPSAPQINRGWQSQDHPIVNVSWDDANTFCKWAGGRLPTEAEWEYAARGGKDGLKYYWGDALSRDKANFFSTGGNDIWDYTSPVRKFVANPWKLYDISGNVWEWVNDWYDAGYYAISPDTDPPGPSKGTEHVKRGGGHQSAEKELRLSIRGHFKGADNQTGFRCVIVGELPN